MSYHLPKLMPNLSHSLIIISGLIFFQPGCASVEKRALQYTAVKVTDGDTIDVRPALFPDAFPCTCRLYGIDAPETETRMWPEQAYGDASTKELSLLVLDKTIDISVVGKDSRGRNICLIYHNGVDINIEMVKRGYAWAYRQYLKQPYTEKYIETEDQAKNKKLGLWQENNPETPWEFRKRMRAPMKEESDKE